MTHAKTYDNVVNKSWNETLESGNIVYGLVEWGYDYTADNQPANTTLSDGYLKSFTAPAGANPLWLEQFKPQIRAKIIWDKIFYDAGYTYDSDFLTSTRFTKLYVLTETETRAKLPTEATFKATGSMSAFSYTPKLQTGSEYVAECKNEEYDFMNAYNKTTYEYTAQTTAAHTFKVRSKYVLQKLCTSCPIPTGNDNIFALWLDNSRPGGAQWFHNSGMIDETTYDTGEKTVTLNLQAGDKITMWVSADCPPGEGPFAVSFQNLLFSCTQAGSDFNVASLLPSTIKKIDFIRSIINKFKLVFVPDKDRINHFKIEPWVDWIRSGSQVDWTNKLDRSKDVVIRPLFDKQTRKVTFTEKEDTDFVNDEYQKSNDKKPFGQLVIDSDIDLITGETTFSTEFAPCPIAPIAGESTGSKKFLIPHIAKDTGGTAGEGVAGNSGKREPIVPKMRLLYYNGLKTSYLTWYMAQGNAGTNPIAKSSHPFFSNFSTWPVTPETFDLNWNNQKPLWNTALSGQTEWSTEFTAYTVYWKDWYDMVYDPYSRIVEATFVLSYVDVLNFNFNDLVFVKDAWYFVNKIKDYTLGETSSCKVELVKIGSDLDLNLNAVSPFTEVNLCFAATACAAYCCCKHPDSCPTYGTYYVDETTFSASQYIYNDPYGATFAPPGYYSDGTNACLVGQGGVIQAFYNTAACDCGAIPDYSFSVNYAKYPCATLGQLAPVTVYGTETAFKDNAQLYLDSAKTIPVPYGYYRETTDTDDTLKLSSAGDVISTVPLAECPPEVYYLFYPNYSATECDSCCSTDERVVYVDTPAYTDATEVWLDNVGAEPAGIGYYAVGDDIMYVDPSGTPASFSVCSGCPACPDGLVSVNVCVYQDLDGYRTIGELYTSVNGTTWVSRGFVEVTTTDPSGTPTCSEFLLDAGLYCKVVFGTDEPGGTLTVTLDEDGEVTFLDDTTTPGTYEIVFPTRLVSGVAYYVTGSVDGGSVVTPTYYAQSLWYEKNLATPCVPYCHVDLTAGTYYGDNLTLATSTYLYTDNLGTTPAYPGWYSDGTVISQVGSNGLLIAGANPKDCNCGGQQTELYEYKTSYDASAACEACGTAVGTPTSVYGTEPVVTDCKVFYVYGPLGIETAPAGFYSINNYWAELDANGVVIAYGRCDSDCTITAYYATYYVINRTKSTVTYSYTGQDDLLYTGTIESGRYILTVCMDKTTLYTSGYCEVIEVASCMP